jgi:hypothetical protein
MVYNVEQLSKIEPKLQAIRIGHVVGKRKKANILAEARRRKIVVLNLREIKETAKEKLAEEEEEKTEKTGKEARKTDVTVEAEDKQEKDKTKKRKERPKEQ